MDKRHLSRHLAWGWVLALGLATSAQALDARIEGLSGAPADNVRHYLSDLEAAQYGEERLEGEILRRTREALRVYGYYAPEITLSLEPNADAPPKRVTLQIASGPPVRIETLALTIHGDAEQDPPFRQALDDFPLAEGDRLRHAPWDRLRNRLAGLSLQRGYFDWRFTERRMEVRPYAESARLYLSLASGPRYHFGPISVRGSHIETARLRRLAPFTPGQPYLASDVAIYTQRLGEVGWFASINVRPRLDEQRKLALPPAPLGWQHAVAVPEAAGRAFGPAPSATPRIAAEALAVARRLHAPARPVMPIDVVVTPADRHQFEVGVGYATDVGPRLRFAWEQPWINRWGHSLDHALYLSAPEQRFTGTYVIPLDDPLRDQYRLQYGLRQRDDEDTRTLESSVELARRWEFDNRWVQTLFLRATYEDFTQGGEADSVLIYYPGISWTRVRTREPRFPVWGDRQRLGIEASSELWGSDADFVRLTADSEWIRMLGDDNRFIGRLGLGAIHSDDFSRVPPSLRFFTGGDRSIRGYAYESLAPRNAEGKLRGGQQLFTASLEYQRRVTGDWWAAAFVDTGDAFDDWWPAALNTGAGLGVRWVSPVGPIRVDLAHPFDDKDNAWRLHFSIGPEF